jgi:hypothetical protein
MAVLPDKSRLTVRTMRVLTGLATLATDWVDDRPIPIAERSADLPLRTRSLDLTNQANQQVRNPWLDLRRLRLDDLGVVATVRWYAYHPGPTGRLCRSFCGGARGRGADIRSQPGQGTTIRTCFPVAYSPFAQHTTEGSQ